VRRRVGRRVDDHVARLLLQVDVLLFEVQRLLIIIDVEFILIVRIFYVF
jgi:hypothetical protein